MDSTAFPKSHLESLWSPWRVEYFEAGQTTSRDFLLEAARSNDDAAHFVVARGRHAFLILNKYPYSAGHLMAVPYRKVAKTSELTDAEALEIWRLCDHAQNLLSEVVKAQGFNVGYNIGRVGGAGCAHHLHLHIVPRWEGDSNFIATIGGTRIIPEGLKPVYEKLRAAHQKSGVQF